MKNKTKKTKPVKLVGNEVRKSDNQDPSGKRLHTNGPFPNSTRTALATGGSEKGKEALECRPWDAEKSA